MVNKELVERNLLLNPKYESEWIETAVKLICEYGWSEENLTEFNTSQIKIILKAEEYNKENQNAPININAFANPIYNATQMTIIMDALQHNISTDVITSVVSPDIPYIISHYVLQAASESKDMIKYVKGYAPEQVFEIYAGLHNNLDVSVYDDATIEAPMMGLIRHALELGKTVEINKETLELIIK